MILLVLATIVIGIAISTGIVQHREGARAANQDEVRHGLTELAARAQAWYRRPVQLGGGGRSFAEITLARINFKGSNHAWEISLSNVESESFRATGISQEDSSWSASVDVFADSLEFVP